MERISRNWIFVLSLGGWALAFLVALAVGSVSDPSWEMIRQLRLPRALLASAIGMGLAVSGAVLQVLFTNPLCEPYTLGISSGAALGAVLGLSFGFQWQFAGVTGAGFVGAILFTVILYTVSMRLHRNNTAVLLAGVMLGFVGTSLVAVWMALSDPNGLQAALGWLFGDLSRARMNSAIATAAGVLVLCIMLWRRSRDLDGLLLGEEGAASVGVDVPQLRSQVILLTSLLVAICVSAGGMIGFIGLVIPHLARRLTGSLHSYLIPLTAIWGGACLTLADCGARVLVRPVELPVGVITALIGAPFFLLIMLRRAR